jgi:AcrR family transcriptional regulator
MISDADVGTYGESPEESVARGGEDEARRMSREEERRASREDRRAQTRAALLDAAERLWAERGIRGASLDEIAAAAGMTKGAVYSNFAGKSDLVLALLERYTQTELSLDLAPDIGEPESSREDRFADASRRYARKLSVEETRMRALLVMELWLFGMRDFSAGWRVADWYHSRREELAAFLTSEDMSAEDRASLAMAIDFGLALQHLLDPDRVPAELHGSGMSLVLGEAIR